MEMTLAQTSRLGFRRPWSRVVLELGLSAGLWLQAIQVARPAGDLLVGATLTIGGVWLVVRICLLAQYAVEIRDDQLIIRTGWLWPSIQPLPIALLRVTVHRGILGYVLSSGSLRISLGTGAALVSPSIAHVRIARWAIEERQRLIAAMAGAYGDNWG